jgi:hypothetical protein
MGVAFVSRERHQRLTERQGHASLFRSCQVGRVERTLGAEVATERAVAALGAPRPVDRVFEVYAASGLHAVEKLLIAELAGDGVDAGAELGFGALEIGLERRKGNGPVVEDVAFGLAGDAVVDDARAAIRAHQRVARSFAQAHFP